MNDLRGKDVFLALVFLILGLFLGLFSAHLTKRYDHRKAGYNRITANAGLNLELLKALRNNDTLYATEISIERLKYGIDGFRRIDASFPNKKEEVLVEMVRKGEEYQSNHYFYGTADSTKKTVQHITNRVEMKVSNSAPR